MFEQVLGFSQIIYAAFNQKFEFLEVSQSAEQYFGQSAERLKSRSVFDILPEEHPISQNIKRKGRFSLYDQRFFLLNISTEVFDMHQFQSDDAIHIFLYPRPSHLEQNLTEMARSSLRQASGMAAILGHEIRNPLGAIKGAAQLLAPNLGADDQALLRVIEEEAMRISRMVNDFEDMAGDSPPNIEPTNIHLVLNQVLRAGRAGFARDIAIQEVYDPSLPEIASDPDRLLRALSNILKNAAEAIMGRVENPDKQGKILVQTRIRRGLKRGNLNLPVELSISDNGGGMDETFLADAFKPFVTTKTNGTGLGLSTVARIIEEFGGVIEVENVNQGCEFRMLFPIWSE